MMLERALFVAVRRNVRNVEKRLATFFGALGRGGAIRRKI
jgi:hypothetical protein